MDLKNIGRHLGEIGFLWTLIEVFYECLKCYFWLLSNLFNYKIWLLNLKIINLFHKILFNNL